MDMYYVWNKLPMEYGRNPMRQARANLKYEMQHKLYYVGFQILWSLFQL